MGAKDQPLQLSLGQLLRQRRDDLGHTLREVEKSTGIRTTYLSRIERGAYGQLPDTVYTKGYVKNYADFLGFDSAEIMRLYTRERLDASGLSTKGTAAWRPVKPLDARKFVFTPKILILLVGVGSALLVFGYIFWQFAQLAVPPKISITNPTTDHVTGSLVILNGVTEPGSELFINNSPVRVGIDGSFSEQVSLVSGSNQITIRARNKLGKSTEVVRNITAQVGEAGSAVAEQLPAELIDGVDLLVTVGTQATWVTIEADGQDSFRGTMLPGSQKLFRARQSIKLTTGNGGSTSLRITNAKVARKDLGQVGRDGEARLDMVFSKDTDFAQ